MQTIDPRTHPRRYAKFLPKNVTQEQWQQGFDHANTCVNTFIGVANEVARIAISDGMDALKRTRHYRHEVKRLCNETLARQERYESIHNANFGDRSKLWLDYLDGVEDDFRHHIFNLYMSFKQVMDRNSQSESDLKAKLECGRVCAMLAVSQFDDLMDGERKRWGADYTALFTPARYDKPLHTWTQLCGILVKDDDPAHPTNLTDDANCKLAYEVLARKLCDEDVLNHIGKRAIGYNLEVASKYAKEEDIKELMELSS